MINTTDLSDYAKNKIDESNIGYQLLKNAGWTEGQGLGSNEDGITAPVNKYVLFMLTVTACSCYRGKISFDQSGVGMEAPGEVSNADNEFDTYRKRMMLAYRFRPNPLVRNQMPIQLLVLYLYHRIIQEDHITELNVYDFLFTFTNKFFLLISFHVHTFWTVCLHPNEPGVVVLDKLFPFPLQML